MAAYNAALRIHACRGGQWRVSCSNRGRVRVPDEQWESYSTNLGAGSTGLTADINTVAPISLHL